MYVPTKLALPMNNVSMFPCFRFQISEDIYNAKRILDETTQLPELLIILMENGKIEFNTLS